MNNIAIVTGASRDIGAATAILLGQRGYQVCVSYRGERDKAEAVVAEIIAAGSKAIAAQADVADPEQVCALFAQVDEQLGTLSALVNNAGMTGPICRFDSLECAALEQVLAVNVFGLMHCVLICTGMCPSSCIQG